MSIFTVRELEFLAGLPTRWPKLYMNEIARLMSEEDLTALAALGGQRSRTRIRGQLRDVNNQAKGERRSGDDRARIWSGAFKFE